MDGQSTRHRLHILESILSNFCRVFYVASDALIQLGQVFFQLLGFKQKFLYIEEQVGMDLLQDC